jgi:hypothetical protein
MTARPTKRIAFGLASVALVGVLVTALRLHANATDGRFMTVADGVLDQVTGLTWQQSDDGTTYTQANAVSHCTGLGGNWRLPQVFELYSIMDLRAANPALDSTFTFSSTGGYIYWTATGAGCPFGDFISLDFSNGASGGTSASTAYRARCVH